MPIERIYTHPPEDARQIDHASVTVIAGAGIQGDRYFGRHDEPGQNITLVEAEEIEAFAREFGRDPGDQAITQRNLVTRGVRLNELVGQEFMVGSVLLRGVELCEPCLGLGTTLASAELTPAAVVKRFLHRAGIRADVLTDGVIATGDAVGHKA
nr:MOSC domain-containing protein [uncultured Roseateles sp.]